MNPSSYLPIFLVLVVLFVILRRRKGLIAKKTVEKRRKGDKKEMVELAKRFVGKECIIYSFDGSRQLDGIIREVSASAILFEKNGKLDAVNLDFVFRIREYPKDKKGNKKSIILD